MYQHVDELERDLRAGVSAQDIIQRARAQGLPFRWHPLGFIVCTLFVNGPLKARLHIWPTDHMRSQGPLCQIHDHVFDLTSWVLFGCIENIQYSQDAVGVMHARYSAEYTGDMSILKKTHVTITLAKSGSSLHKAGFHYEVAAAQLHESRRVGLTPAVTVLITRDVSQDSPLVIGPLDGPVRYEYIRSALTNEELDHALRGI